MIITRTPLRISIGGGGTDLPSYYEKFGGFVISAAINKHVYITANRTFRPGYYLKYAKTEYVENIDDVEHDIIREGLRLLDMGPNIEIVSIADVPAGTGLGSSGSFTVSLLHTLHAYNRRPIGTEELAATANNLEMNILGDPCGKQDHYISAYGGVICQDYHQDGSVSVASLKASDETLRDLRDNLLLFFTGYSRTAADVLTDQKDKSEDGDAEMLENLHFTKELGLRIKDVLEAGDTLTFAEMMNEHWARKRERSSGISSSSINDLYDVAMKNGARGGKLVGAGGGGFLMFYADDRRKLRKAMAEQGLSELDFSFDHDGSIVQLRS